ncbi:MAG: asparagine synthase (glutamine-hydrolyzing) [Cytophagales bacterium]|nr:MAG: asparagine synthase (glutamine-hydrolyzing) [Cytophagales bacterium]
MCGITGIFAFNEIGRFHSIKLPQATSTLAQRGPDDEGFFVDYFVSLGHKRLSIIDLAKTAHQPMYDEQKRYVIAYNGEIFNFKTLREELITEGYTFFSQSDTEVVLKSYMAWGEKCLQKLDGFFAFALYDTATETLLVARDKMGVKPLLYYADEDKFIFASEMKALLSYGIDTQLDVASLHQYLSLNYIAAPESIFSHVKKLPPAHYLKIKKKEVSLHSYQQISTTPKKPIPTYENAQKELQTLLRKAVQKRLIADVPIGTFLSGGVDSAIVTLLAAQEQPNIEAFSIGFSEMPFFDETHYAKAVAQKAGIKHHIINLKNEDFLEAAQKVLEYTDEPFADSSAVAMYALCKHTRKHITVALSGDGSDEVWAGYNKHWAEYQIEHPSIGLKLASQARFLLPFLKKSREGFFSNKIRQLEKWTLGKQLDFKERYWRWCGFLTESESLQYLLPALRTESEAENFSQRKQHFLASLEAGNFNSLLLADTKGVLPNDMLQKVDLMSMANSLEVRSPFLDWDLVNFAFSLPASYKINARMRKRLVQDAFRNLLPKSIYNRPKKGFEIPLRAWLRQEFNPAIKTLLLDADFLIVQGIFEPKPIKTLVEKLHSQNPEDSHATVWALLVFQHWWKKYMPKEVQS